MSLSAITEFVARLTALESERAKIHALGDAAIFSI